MGLQLRGLCLLFLFTAKLGLADEESGESAPQAEMAVEETEQAQEREEVGPSLGSDDLAAMSEAEEGPVLVSDVRRRTSGERIMDEMDLGRTEITGNQELPTVMYIVPWQKSDPGQLMGRPVNTLLDEVLAPIDRSVFIRQVEYYGDLHDTDDE